MVEKGNTVWKCFRCELYFESSETARLHESITSHKVRKVRKPTPLRYLQIYILEWNPLKDKWLTAVAKLALFA